MAVIHQTTLSPSKLALLASWLPSQPWYVATGRQPDLVKAGGFRLDDPGGAVGIEFMMITDRSGPAAPSYLVPLTYRGAPLTGIEHALIGTAEHGVLGPRWIYDGMHDPVLVGQLVALIDGAVQAQAQSISDTPDPTVVSHFSGTWPPAPAAPAAVASGPDGTDVTVAPGLAIRVVRRLQQGTPESAAGVAGMPGYVEAGWLGPDGAMVRGPLVIVRAGSAPPSV
jgi:hypothetical protein